MGQIVFKNTRKLADQFTTNFNMSENTNNFAFFSSIYEEILALFRTNQDLMNRLDINQASGKNLDNLGANFGVDRRGMLDDQYRALIKAEIISLSEGGLFDTLVNILSLILQVPKENVFLNEGNGFIEIIAITGVFDLEIANEVIEIVNKIKAFGVRIGRIFVGADNVFQFSVGNPHNFSFGVFGSLLTANSKKPFLFGGIIENAFDNGIFL